MISDTEIDAVAPWDWSFGTVDVTVTTPGGISGTSISDQYTYFSPPTVTSVSPQCGSPDGGTEITITGTGFTGAMGVFFDNIPAESFFANGDTEIDAISPQMKESTGYEDVRVVNSAGISQSSPADYYSYAAIITGVSPISGPANGGNIVTITGACLTGATKVVFGCEKSTDTDCMPATEYSLVNDNMINAVVPGYKSAGSYNIVVTNAAGDNNGDVYYRFLPVVTRVFPVSGPQSGTNTVTITGSGFSDAGGVYFGNTESPAVSVINNENIIAEVPPGSARHR